MLNLYKSVTYPLPSGDFFMTSCLRVSEKSREPGSQELGNGRSPVSENLVNQPPIAVVMQSKTCCSPRENLYPFFVQTTRHERSSEHYAVVRLGMYRRSIALAFASSTCCINTL